MIRVGVMDDFEGIDRFDPFAGDRRAELAQSRVLVAEADGQIVGYVTFSNPGFIGRPFVHFVAVESNHRRRGIARRLLHAVEERIAAGRLFTSTEENNEPMLALLDREAWSFAGTIQGVNEDGSAERFYFRDIVRA